MKTIYIQSIVIVLMLVTFHVGKAQTVILPGEVSGSWLKHNSPYQITGDINIPPEQTLFIEPGVMVKFMGSFVFNVQGRLMANGTQQDSILFTIPDTNGFMSNTLVGWNGIHFDSRPIRWDTVSVDSKMKISLALDCPDDIKDNRFRDKGRKEHSGSQLSFCRFEYGSYGRKQRPYIFGGVIYIFDYSNLTVRNSVFYNNRSYAGGAIYCKEASPIIEECTFNKCTAISSGGAMVFIHSGPILIRNTIEFNKSGYNGGGMLFYESCPFVINCKIHSNEASNIGGGIYIENDEMRVINDGDFSLSDSSNLPSDVLSDFRKRISGDENKNGAFVGNIICSNMAMNGGAVGICASAPQFINNTISNNNCHTSGGAFWSFYASPVIVNSIIYGNYSRDTGQEFYFVGKNNIEISFCDIGDGITGFKQDSTGILNVVHSNVINEEPHFYDKFRGDYSLKSESNCIDMGNSDTIALYLPEFDLNKHKRIINSAIDIGAVEFQGEQFSKLKSASKIDSTELEFDKEPLFHFFPNPNTGYFSMLVSNCPFDNVKALIYNPSGTLVMERKIGPGENFEENFDMRDYPVGIYMIQITTDSEILVKQALVIE